MELLYKIKTGTQRDIYSHLCNCDNNFIPVLSTTIDLNEYSNKIYNKSITFETWDENLLVGLIACYFNQKSAFITNVSTLSNYHGNGIASKLFSNCIKYAKESNSKEIKLEVNKLNEAAIRIYNKFGFTIFEQQGETLIMKLELYI